MQTTYDIAYSLNSIKHSSNAGNTSVHRRVHKGSICAATNADCVYLSNLLNYFVDVLMQGLLVHKPVNPYVT